MIRKKPEKPKCLMRFIPPQNFVSFSKEKSDKILDILAPELPVQKCKKHIEFFFSRSSKWLDN